MYGPCYTRFVWAPAGASVSIKPSIAARRFVMSVRAPCGTVLDAAVCCMQRYHSRLTGCQRLRRARLTAAGLPRSVASQGGLQLLQVC